MIYMIISTHVISKHGTWLAQNSGKLDCDEWNQLPNSQIFVVMKMFKTEMFSSGFSIVAQVS